MCSVLLRSLAEIRGGRGKWLTVVVAVASTLGLAALLLLGIAPQRTAAAVRPNIIFIKTDDQPESTLSHMPNVQNLIRAKGRTFTNAFNAYPLCCPSRAIMQRGQYAHNTGVFGNGPATGGGWQVFDGLDMEKSTIATWMDAAGYRTVHVGRYMNGYVYGYSNGSPITPPPPGWDSFNATPAGTSGETETETHYNRAMAQLRDAAPRAEPFYMEVGFAAPHNPNDFESQYAGMFSGERVPRVPSFDEQDVSDKPRYIREDKPPLSLQTNTRVSDACQDDELNSVEQNDCEYVRILRNLQTVDRFVKDMTDYLAAQGELSNTYVVYYTDNANHLGEHRLDYGKLAPYETEAGFPLMIRGPNIPAGTTSSKLVGNQDIPLTFAQIGGASAPPFVDGRSFLRVADADPSNDSPWRTALYAERRWKSEWTRDGKDSDEYMPPWEAVREENSVYIRYGDDPWTAANDAGFTEYYDLNSDPYQTRNLVHHKEVPQAILDRMQGRLLKLRGCASATCRSAEDEAVGAPDATKPTVTLTTPPTGAVYFLNQAVKADYSCRDEAGGSGMRTCSGSVASGSLINTASAGAKTFTVTATDNAGNTNTVTHTYTVASGCTVTGTSGADALTGTAGDDVICGGLGNDTLKGIGGNDLLKGEDGNDQLHGGLGNDTLDGGPSTDHANYSSSPSAVDASLARNSATGEGADTLANTESIVGSHYWDTLTGSGAGQALAGLSGRDTLHGLDGADSLDGGAGSDTAHGGLGNDSLVGGAGSEADYLLGDGGDDALNSKDAVGGNDFLDGGTHLVGDTAVTDATENLMVGFP